MIESFPKSWPVSKLDDLLNYIQPTKYIVESTEYYKTGSVPVLTAGKSFILGYTLETDGIFSTPPVIIFDDFTTATKLVNFPFKVKSSAMKILQPRNTAVNLKYVFFYMQTIRVTTDTHKRYWISEYSKLPVPTPTGDIQQVIVSKIEELFSEIDKGIETLKTAQKQLKVYRQSVLDSAFSGAYSITSEFETTAENHISQVVNSIHLEKKSIFETLGFRFSIPKEILPVESFNLPKLPEQWLWITAETISAPEKYSIGIGPFGSNLKITDYRTEGVPLVFVKNITRNDYARDLKYISQQKFKELIAHSIKPLDILITKMGSPPGDCSVYPDNRPPAVITSDCLKLRVWTKYGDVSFFKYAIESNIIKKQLLIRTKGVAQKKISLERFRTVHFPFTHINEQKRIVQEIESRLSVADKMEETITQSLLQAEALKQSILKKAFEGKLIQ